MRVGEMMVVVRAQDFASRTLRRVSGELTQMSRSQALTMRRHQIIMRQMAQADRARNLMERGRGLQMLRHRLELEQKLAQVQSGTGPLRDPTGKFTSRTRMVSQLNTALQSLDARLSQVDPALQRLGMRLRAFPEAGAILDRALAGNRRALDQLRIGIGLTRGELEAIERQIRGLPIERLDNLAHALSGIGRTMQLFGAVGVVSLGLAAKGAADFDKSISLAATQARDLTADATQIKVRIDQLTNGFAVNGREIDGVLDLMRQYPADAQQMSNATYDIFSSMDLERGGIIDVAKGLGLLTDANQIAVAGGVDLEEATSAMITVLNNFAPSLENVTEQYDTMFDIVRFGRMRLSDFNIMMNKIAPAAADAGMKLRDVGGAMAYLTTVMPSQRMVATGISRLIEAFRNPDVQKGLRMFGIAVEDATGKMRPLDAIMKDIAETFPLLRTGQKSAAQFFREISAAGRGGGRGQMFTAEGRRAFSQIITHMDEYLDAQSRIDTNTNEFAEAQKAQMESIGVQWDIFMNRVRALVLAIGADAVPAFAELGKIVEGFLKWWESLDEGTREAIVRFGVFGSAITLLGGAALAIIGSMLALEAAIRKLMMSAGAGSTVLGSLKTVLARIGAIGAISLIINAKMTGETSAKSLLAGIAMGALAGASFGPWGIVAGAITVPIMMHVMAQGSIEDEMSAAILEVTSKRTEKWRQYGRYAASQINAGLMETIMSPEEFFDFRDKFGPDSGVAKIEAHRAKLHNSNLREAEKATKDAAAATKKHKDVLGDYYKALQANREKQSRFNTDLKEWRDNLSDATADAKKAAIDNLRSMYMEMESINEQAFGSLFQGPWLTSETFDIAKEWGIEPRIQDLIRDLKEQNTQFAQWRTGLDKLMKKGLPREFIDELRAMGPEEGQGILNQLLSASPQQVNALVTQWKRKNAQIKAATKMDFTAEIKAFKKAGGDMGDAIINGFKDAEVGKWFDSWVQVTFPGVINAAVNKAVNEWKASNVKPVAPTPPTPPKALVPSSNSSVTNNNNQKTAQVTVNLGDSGATAKEKADARMAGFIVSGAVKGALGRR